MRIIPVMGDPIRAHPIVDLYRSLTFATRTPPVHCSLILAAQANALMLIMSAAESLETRSSSHHSHLTGRARSASGKGMVGDGADCPELGAAVQPSRANMKLPPQGKGTSR